jgi:hypothetical protein
VIFKQFNTGTARDRVPKLATPAGIRIAGEVGDITRGGRDIIRVCLLIVVGREMVKGLNCGTSDGVIADSIFGCAVKVFDSMQGGFVMFMGGIVVV